MTRVIGLDATCGADLSAAEIEGKRQMREIIAWLKEDHPEFADARLMYMAVQIGIRESRRITGLYQLVLDDYKACRRFPDAIARCAYMVDIHSPWGAVRITFTCRRMNFMKSPTGALFRSAKST